MMKCRIIRGKKVVVIGGGNVAMDVARSLSDWGSETVSDCSTVRRKADMTRLKRS